MLVVHVLVMVILYVVMAVVMVMKLMKHVHLTVTPQENVLQVKF